jgi:hypothetical protein
MKSWGAITIALAWAAVAVGGPLPIKNGRLTTNLDANGYKVTGLATPTASTDAATKGYSDTLAGAKAAALHTHPYTDILTPPWLTEITSHTHVGTDIDDGTVAGIRVEPYAGPGTTGVVTSAAGTYDPTLFLGHDGVFRDPNASPTEKMNTWNGNLLVNGGFDADTAWTKSANITIANGKVNFIDFVMVPWGPAYVSQVVGAAIVVGHTYTITFEAVDYVADHDPLIPDIDFTIGVTYAGGSAFINPSHSGMGQYSVEIEATDGADTTLTIGCLGTVSRAIMGALDNVAMWDSDSAVQVDSAAVTLPGKRAMTAEWFDNMEDVADIVVQGAVPGSDEALYPVLSLELGGQWTDFELKASTNNFDAGTETVYFIRSWMQTACPYDSQVRIYFQDDSSTNPWEWKLSAYTNSILSQLVDPTHTEIERVMVYPSRECEYDAIQWMNKTNANLTWSYVRFNGLNFETNAAGKIHHVITEPVKWVGSRPSW